jgi:bifunctional DNA-binding transcriptional regulator/antitoxin component of YhaV-PrlF toxin-antitoxin module
MIKMETLYIFKAIIMSTDKVDGAYVKFPYDTNEVFGSKGIIKVIATFDGYEYRGILANMGMDCHIIGITKAIRAKIGKAPGDEIEVTIRKDEGSRLVEIPESLSSALSVNSEAKEFFDTLTDSQKNKFITHITSAKKKETADARLQKVIEMLANKEKMK